MADSGRREEEGFSQAVFWMVPLPEINSEDLDFFSDTSVSCFYCRGPAAACPDCGLLASCSAHLTIHRPVGDCLPWTVAEVPGKGRTVVATRDIKPFQTIILDRPAIVGPFDDASSLLALCLECSARLEDGHGQPCSQCSLPLCGTACEGGPVHGAECALLATASPPLSVAEDGVFGAVSPLRMLAVRRERPDVWDLVDRLMHHLPERRREEKWRYVTEMVLPLITERCGATWAREGEDDSQANLKLHIKQSIPEQFSPVQYWRDPIPDLDLDLEEPSNNATKSQQAAASEGKELMERIIGIFRTNSVKWERERAGGGVEPVGHALLPIFSLLSHSCVNNTRYTQTRDGGMVVRAAVPIAKGEEVTTQYRGPNEGNILRQPEIPQNWSAPCSPRRAGL
jgi:hypothetical protein